MIFKVSGILFSVGLLAGCITAPQDAASTASLAPNTAESSSAWVSLSEVGVREDKAAYAGLLCGDTRLGISLKQFRTEAKAKNYGLADEASQFSTFQKWYRVSGMPAPVTGAKWTPILKFVHDGNAFRLYSIEGILNGGPDVLTKLERQYGSCGTEAPQHTWKRGGTTLRVMTGTSSAVLSFTHDQLLDLNRERTETMESRP